MPPFLDARTAQCVMNTFEFLGPHLLVTRGNLHCEYVDCPNPRARLGGRYTGRMPDLSGWDPRRMHKNCFLKMRDEVRVEFERIIGDVNYPPAPPSESISEESNDINHVDGPDLAGFVVPDRSPRARRRTIVLSDSESESPVRKMARVAYSPVPPTYRPFDTLERDPLMSLTMPAPVEGFSATLAPTRVPLGPLDALPERPSTQSFLPISNGSDDGEDDGEDENWNAVWAHAVPVDEVRFEPESDIEYAEGQFTDNESDIEIELASHVYPVADSPDDDLTDTPFVPIGPIHLGVSPSYEDLFMASKESSPSP